MRARIEATPGVAMIVRDLVGATSRIETTSFPCCNARTASCCHRSGIINPVSNRAHGTSEIEGKVARVATSKLGDERVSNPGIILGRCLQCGLLAIGIGSRRTNRTCVHRSLLLYNNTDQMRIRRILNECTLVNIFYLTCFCVVCTI